MRPKCASFAAQIPRATMGKVFRNDQPERFFLDKNINFLAILAVLLTTLFGWFRLNSWSIILLVLCRLLDGNPVSNIKTAFANRIFLAYFILTAIGAAGFFYSYNLAAQANAVSKECTMVAIAFAFCAGPFADQQRYRKLFTAYCLLLLASSLYCLVVAGGIYLKLKDTNYFFYHLLTTPISQNAVFYSVYMLFGIVFLVSADGGPLVGRLSPRSWKRFRYGLLIFFLGMMILLSSRLMLVILLLILAGNFARRYSFLKHKAVYLIAGSVLVATVGFLVVKDTFIRGRFLELGNGDMNFIHRDEFSPDTRLGSRDSRLIQWRFAVEILNIHHAWLFGVSPGDSQDLLDQKYIAAHMNIGNPAEGPRRHNRGYLGFNFHDQFVETLVRSGLLGLAALVSVFIVLFAAVSASGTREAWIVLLTLTAFCIPEAPLTLQHGVFLFCFFPPLVLSRLGTDLNRSKFATKP
jgi:O-antigen ligase